MLERSNAQPDASSPSQPDALSSPPLPPPLTEEAGEVSPPDEQSPSVFITEAAQN